MLSIPEMGYVRKPLNNVYCADFLFKDALSTNTVKDRQNLQYSVYILPDSYHSLYHNSGADGITHDYLNKATRDQFQWLHFDLEFPLQVFAQFDYRGFFGFGFDVQGESHVQPAFREVVDVDIIGVGTGSFGLPAAFGGRDMKMRFAA